MLSPKGRATSEENDKDMYQYLEIEEPDERVSNASPLAVFPCYRRQPKVVLAFSISIIIFALALIYLILPLGFDPYMGDTNVFGFGRKRTVESQKVTRVVLFGDSLINKPFNWYDFGDMIRSRLPENPTEFINEGQNGNTILSMRNRLDSALAHDGDAVIMFWDSDVSDIDETVLTYEEVVELRARYVANLRYVVNATLNYPTVRFLAIAGPGLLGEGPILLSPRFRGKDPMLDAYLALNEAVAAEFGVPYINARHALQNALPSFWPLNRWYVTIDGEHLNLRGTAVIADLFATALRQWFEYERVPQHKLIHGGRRR